MPYFQKILLPDYLKIKEQLKIMSFSFIKEKLRYKDVSNEWIEQNVPLLHNLIEERKIQNVRSYRFYITPPKSELLPHIDGHSKLRSPLGLNLPIIGYEHVFMNWYSCPDDNFKDGPYGFYRSPASRIINFNLLKHEISTIIDTPTFVRQDIPHGIKNTTNSYRIVLSIRFQQNGKIGKEFHEVFKYFDLLFK